MRVSHDIIPKLKAPLRQNFSTRLSTYSNISVGVGLGLNKNRPNIKLKHKFSLPKNTFTSEPEDLADIGKNILAASCVVDAIKLTGRSLGSTRFSSN